MRCFFPSCLGYETRTPAYTLPASVPKMAHKKLLLR